jgi:Fur family ferric uptake transcriptional regulator
LFPGSEPFPNGSQSYTLRNVPETSAVHDAALQRLRAKGQRYTRSRRQIVDTLADAPDPQTIVQLLSNTPGLAQSSAYRNLAVLEDADVVHRIVTSDNHAHFELTEDITGSHHHHLVCTACGIVLDVGLSEELERRLHDELGSVAAGRGFRGAHHRIDVIGLCSDCSQR